MEETFLKTAIPAQDPCELDDSSLALPTAPTPRSSTRNESGDRSLRVQQQVQLTLARKTKRSFLNGGAHLQTNTSRSFDGIDGFLSNAKVNGSGFTSQSLCSSHVRRPTRRVEVSPPPSPELSRTHYNYRLHGSRIRASNLSAPGSFNRRSLRLTARPQSKFGTAAFQQNTECDSPWSYRQNTVKQEKRTVQEHNNATFGPTQPDRGLSWLAQVRRDGQRSLRVKSYSPSVNSAEVDMGRHVEVELPTQQIQSENVTVLNSGNRPPEMTLERAVSLLTQDDEETLICATNCIQSQCFQGADARKMVFYLHGIEKLMQLLDNSSEEVQRVTAGALRNVVYQSSKNKMEVKDKDGLAIILNALANSQDMETRRQLTGLLWNLSSHDLLKERFPRQAVHVLTKSVLVPSSGISEGENPKDELLADSDAFYNATGCLRNLSSAGPDVRKAIRECENLIDSLVYYIRGTVANYKTDDKSTENCICILHNLTYQAESELLQHSTQHLRESRQNLAPKTTSVGCFAYRSAKIAKDLEHEPHLLEEKANPHGTEWLWSPITIRMYLSLVACSTRNFTQEAAIGALQNITAGNGAMSEAIAVTIVQRENGLQHVKKVLEEGDSQMKRTAISLIKNLSRYQELHPTIVNHVLPDVVKMLPKDDTGTDLPNEGTISLCHILINLSQSDMKNVKAIINLGALPKIMNISKTDNGYGLSRAGQAACVLLHTMWRHRDLHGVLKRCGFKKSDFINARTTKAVNSMQN
ncbi:plakophilin-2 isoform X2 [Melanotaenia boesemani]|uniref:plakophilin-2 isoform X2 n=1 Tax=Melanotaenia boesemani TaxID=1250792 RepID=UPI001C05788A|nr:plakophilin-2 isoform X2 [Melanotaenia boesemani]